MTGTEHDGLRGSGATPLEEEDPRRVGPVRLLGRLGAGGMGRVYLGVHEGRYVAVKQVLPSLSHEGELFLRRFGHELDNLARLPADSTAPLRISDRTASPPWFATAYVPGITLGDARLLCGGSLRPSALWPLLREAAQGLVAVHALDMVHRDLKPSNVMLTAEGATLIDFGVARAADQTQLTRTDMVIGTPAYMAPEQASGKRGSALTGAVDVFALGSVLACAATGNPPFGDESGPAVLYRIVHEAPDLGDLADVDPELADVVRSCLSKRPEDRPTAVELLRRAEAEGPFAPPLWPEPVQRAVTERAEFTRRPVPAAPPEAATAPDPAPVAPPAPESDTEREDGGKDGATGGATDGREDRATDEAGGGKARRKARGKGVTAESEPRRRTRFLPVIIPVVLGVGTTLLVQLLPYVTDADERAGGPGTSASAPATTGAAGSAGTPSEGAGASRSPSGSPGPSDKDGEDGKDAEGGDDGKGEKGGRAAGGADGGGAEGGSGGTDAGDPDTGSGTGGSGDGTSGGSSGGSSTTSGGSTGGGVTTGPTIQNVSTSACLNAGPGNASAGSCSGAASSWSFRAVSGGVQIVSQNSGQCLASYGSVHMGACGTADTQVWTRGSDGTLRVRSTGECLGVNGFLLLHQTCNGSATQRWR